MREFTGHIYAPATMVKYASKEILIEDSGILAVSLLDDFSP